MKKTILLFAMALLAAPVFTFPQNPTLANLPDTTLYVVPNGDLCPDGACDMEILAYADMVYDKFRHKIMAFGGGHSTQYPSEVVEFDPNTLAWTYLVEPVDCGIGYTASNALLTAGGAPLGGFRYNNKIYAGSRHTYDGLEMAPDTCIMVMGQGFEFKGCDALSDATYNTFYKGGSGLFTFNPITKAWSVSSVNGLTMPYCISEFSPLDPDWLYYGDSGYDTKFWKINWKTFQKVQLANRPWANVDHALTYCPLNNSFYEFSEGGDGSKDIYRYNIAGNAWTVMNPQGFEASTYSINVEWDTLQKVFACFDNTTGDFCYYNVSENKWYRIDQNLGIKRLFHHCVYDPVNNVYLMVGTNDNWRFITYAYKFSDTPGKYPGTGLTASLAMAPAAQGINVLSVSPNPLHSSCLRIAVPPWKTGDRLLVYDAGGRLVSDLSSGVRNRAARWDGTSHAAGVYVLVYRSADQTISAKILNVR